MNVTVRGRSRRYRTVDFDPAQNTVRLIDQRLLPHRFTVIDTRSVEETAFAIRDMVVRGAGAIGATAAYGLAQGVRAFHGDSVDQLRADANNAFHTLAAARPTAIDPVNAMRFVRGRLEHGTTIDEWRDIALTAAREFAEDNISECRKIGEHGASLIRESARVLTHCNAGWLAFVDIGSATAPLYEAQAAGRTFHVFCDETRPRCQGASLTAWELKQQGIPHEIIPDNAAGHLMQRGEIDLVIVGADRVLARTGEVANKIGTYTKAVLASRHGIPFYVAIPFSTLDAELARGDDIPIEERSPDEVLGAWGASTNGRRAFVRIANPGSPARNPAFDVTPPELITGIITPAGIINPQRDHSALLDMARHTATRETTEFAKS
jgi:S-methyl-5-thioribose-1-phosphate isomerase